jgi:hypothetical protein
MFTHCSIVGEVLFALDSSRFSLFDQSYFESILADFLGFITSFLFTNFRVKLLREV